MQTFMANVLGLLLLGSLPLLADQITMKNGDRLSGSILKSDAKTVTIKSEYAGTVTVDWSAVTGISSSQPLNFTLKDGQVVVGTAATEGAEVTIATESAGKVTTAKESIAAIRSKEEQARHEAELDRLRNPRLLDLWRGFVDFGLATARGNAKTTANNLQVNANRSTPRDKVAFTFTQIYSTNSTQGPREVVANARRGGVRYDLNISPRWHSFGFTDLEFDEFQRLDLRWVGGGGMGYYLFKSEKRGSLSAFTGGSVNKEFFQDDLRRTSGELLFGDDLTLRLSDATRLTQRMVFYPNLSESGAYRINFDTSLATNLNRWLAWQFTVSDRFLSNPAPGARKNDVLFTTGIRVTFDPTK